MSTVQVVAFCGKARAGKDTAAILMRDWIQKRNDMVPHEQNYVIGVESFAAPIKTMAAVLLDYFGMGSIMDNSTLVPFIEGDRREEVIEGIGVSTRQILQTLGTEWGRDTVNPDLWLNCMETRIRNYEMAKDHGYKGAIVFITDLRFDNEAQLVRRLGGRTIKIIRDDLPAVAPHVSEAGIAFNLIDEVVSNNSSFEDLAISLALGSLVDIIPPIPTEDQAALMFPDWEAEAPDLQEANL